MFALREGDVMKHRTVAFANMDAFALEGCKKLETFLFFLHVTVDNNNNKAYTNITTNQYKSIPREMLGTFLKQNKM